VPLDVTTSTHPTVPDCARHVEGVAAAEERVIRCDFLIPPDEPACLMPYVVEATGTSADGTVVGARAESRVSLSQDAPCGPDPGPASTDIALPATDLGVTPGSRAVAGPDWIALSAVVVVGIAACAVALLGRRRRPG
jgi:hypothetical protein